MMAKGSGIIKVSSIAIDTLPMTDAKSTKIKKTRSKSSNVGLKKKKNTDYFGQAKDAGEYTLEMIDSDSKPRIFQVPDKIDMTTA